MESDRDVYSHPHALEDLEDREVTVSIGGRTIANLRFADDIDGSAGEEEELVKLVERLEILGTEKYVFSSSSFFFFFFFSLPLSLHCFIYVFIVYSKRTSLLKRREAELC